MIALKKLGVLTHRMLAEEKSNSKNEETSLSLFTDVGPEFEDGDNLKEKMRANIQKNMGGR